MEEIICNTETLSKNMKSLLSELKSRKDNDLSINALMLLIMQQMYIGNKYTYNEYIIPMFIIL